MSFLDNVIPFLAGLVVASWKAQEKTRDLQGRTVPLIRSDGLPRHCLISKREGKWNPYDDRPDLIRCSRPG